ncbi:hypothetical protein KC19_12G145500 [Ceratodon purpureus]|uniref:Uncharacterized protein n=1 Tax=Ceratodon purpureus TaxID=3225 RepID=A0A8T0G8H8_CERPU|nr:hypothetical protein KC19_12G145500 [Ceratodon purpureus]
MHLTLAPAAPLDSASNHLSSSQNYAHMASRPLLFRPRRGGEFEGFGGFRGAGAMVALDERHHTFLQALMRRGPLPEGESKMFRELFSCSDGFHATPVYPQATLAELKCGTQLEAILSDTCASGSILSMPALILRLDIQVLHCPLRPMRSLRV